jgi:hypothetical protein
MLWKFAAEQAFLKLLFVQYNQPHIKVKRNKIGFGALKVKEKLGGDFTPIVYGRENQPTQFNM